MSFVVLAAGLIIGKDHPRVWWLPAIGFAAFGVVFVALYSRLRCPRCDLSFFGPASALADPRWPKPERFNYCPRCGVNLDDEMNNA